MPFTVLVTVGTTKFDALIDAVYSGSMLDVISTYESPRILIQHGASRISADHAKHRGSIIGTDCFCSRIRGVDIYSFPYTSSFSALLTAADVVIAHAGAGTILEALRTETRPRLLAVPNNALMDDHQRELADALQGKYLCVGSTLYVCANRTLADDLQRTLAAEFLKFPPQAPYALADIVRGAWR